MEVGNEVAASLREAGADLIVCITHMRLNEDQELCRKSKQIDLVLGGHDHFCYLEYEALL